MKTERLASETGDVDGGVAVATMGRSAFAAGPSPDIQIFYSLRPAARVAARAGLGGVGLVHFCKNPPVRDRIYIGGSPSTSTNARRARPCRCPRRLAMWTRYSRRTPRRRR